MTRVEELPAGRDLDALVAEHVFKALNWEHDFVTDDIGVGQCARCDAFLDQGVIRGRPLCTDPRHYSTSISAAWEVVAHLQRPGQHHELRVTGYNDDEWFCDIGMGFLSGPRVTGEGHTAAEAICRAALKAVGYEGEP